LLLPQLHHKKPGNARFFIACGPGTMRRHFLPGYVSQDE